MEIIGSKPCPRILVWGIEPGSELGDFIDGIAPTVRFLQPRLDLDYVRQAEWDAAIVVGDPPANPSLKEHLKVIQFGGSRITGYMTVNPAGWVHVLPRGRSVATEFIVPNDISPKIEKLVSTTLLPMIRSQTGNYVLGQHNTGMGKVRDIIRPFVLDADRLPLAGSIKLASREWWWLPEETPYKDLWIAAALSEWSNSDPLKFPAEPIWVKRAQWQTSEERNALAALDQFHDERSRSLADMEQRERELVQRCEDLRRGADRRERRLLTAQGNDLVEEVHAALEELGFVVQDVDLEEASSKGIKLEDLRVEDSAVDGWIALSEVRGYSSGAKSSDFQRIGRFVEHYIRTTGQEPSSRWYIVNHNLKADPSARPPVLAGAADDVSIFEDAGGLVIDTRTLFSIRDQVRTGTLEPEAARRFMRDSRGILGLPAQPDA